VGEVRGPGQRGPSYKRGVLSLRAELPRSVYEQEYECRFVAPANSYFVPEHVDALLEPLSPGMELLDLGGGLKV
jgi:hypothetical protein